MAVSMAVAVHGHGCGALLERSRRRGGDSIRRYGQRAERRTRLSWGELSPGLDTLDVNPRRTLDVPLTYPRRQAWTLDTIFCGDSLDRSLVLDI